MKKLQTITAVISVFIVAIAVILTAKYCGRVEEETTTMETTTKSTEISAIEPITEALTTTEIKNTTTTKKPSETEYEPITNSVGYVSPAFFKKAGRITDGQYWFTYYSERVLPGGALEIPSRHSDGDYVRDADEYIVLASPDLQKIPKGTVVETPVGTGKVYDHNAKGDSIDVYVSW